MDKDAILNRILEIQTALELSRADYSTQVLEVKKLLYQKNKIEEAFDVIRKQLTEAALAAQKAKDILDENVRLGKLAKGELEALKRELARVQDQEKIYEEYKSRLDVFKDKCLESTWRRENRDDGKGALQHQIDGAILAATEKSALLADKRGLGKTLTSLIWCDLIEAKKILVLCPSDTMDNFSREVSLWTPHRQCLPMGKIPRGQRDFILRGLRLLDQYIIVMNYEAWRKDESLIDSLIGLGLDTIILDEAHHLKTLKTTASSGVMRLRFGVNTCPRCSIPSLNKLVCRCGYEGTDVLDFCSIKNVLPMTGTPVLNRPQELFPLLKLVDSNNFRTEKNFLTDFCYKDPMTNHWRWRSGGEKELVIKIGPRYIARDAQSAGVIIPPIAPVFHTIKMDELEANYPRQFKAYEQVRQYGQLVLDPDREITMSMPIVLAVLLRLRQVITWPAGIELKDGDEVIARLNIEESAKIDLAETLIKEIIDEGERVVLFSQFKSPLHELNRRLGYRSIIYDGSTTQYMRNQIQLDFDPKTVTKKPRWDIVLCNYRSAGEGLNLHGASSMLILDEEWSPGKQQQAYGRVNRLGQTRDTTIHTIRVEPSVDSWMAGLLAEKETIVGGFDSQAAFFRRTYDALLNGEM